MMCTKFYSLSSKTIKGKGKVCQRKGTLRNMQRYQMSKV